MLAHPRRGIPSHSWEGYSAGEIDTIRGTSKCKDCWEALRKGDVAQPSDDHKAEGSDEGTSGDSSIGSTSSGSSDEKTPE